MRPLHADPQEQARQFCVDDFYKSLKTACEEAGGNFDSVWPPGSRSGLTISALANILAQNGVRFVYDRNRDITNVKSKTVFYF